MWVTLDEYNDMLQDIPFPQEGINGFEDFTKRKVRLARSLDLNEDSLEANAYAFLEYCIADTMKGIKE